MSDGFIVSGGLPMANDAAIARCARDLADALMTYAHDRRAEDKARVADLQTQLCATRRAELTHERADA